MHKKTIICYHSSLALPQSIHTLKFFISAESPVLWTFFLSSLVGVRQNIALHASCTTRKNYHFLVAINFSFCNFIPIFDMCDFLFCQDMTFTVDWTLKIKESVLQCVCIYRPVYNSVTCLSSLVQISFCACVCVGRKLTRSRRAEDTIPKKRLLQLIKVTKYCSIWENKKTNWCQFWWWSTVCVMKMLEGQTSTF